MITLIINITTGVGLAAGAVAILYELYEYYDSIFSENGGER